MYCNRSTVYRVGTIIIILYCNTIPSLAMIGRFHGGLHSCIRMIMGGGCGIHGNVGCCHGMKGFRSVCIAIPNGIVVCWLGFLLDFQSMHPRCSTIVQFHVLYCTTSTSSIHIAIGFDRLGLIPVMIEPSASVSRTINYGMVRSDRCLELSILQ